MKKTILGICILSLVFMASTCGEGYEPEAFAQLYVKNNTDKILFFYSDSEKYTKVKVIYPNDSAKIADELFGQYYRITNPYQALENIIHNDRRNFDTIQIQPIGEQTAITYISSDSNQYSNNFFRFSCWKEGKIFFMDKDTAYTFVFEINKEDLLNLK
ncbi:MAG: hypothetical protein IJV31_10880 [Clostridia bacterium]|nr:hypothetical protein [Clostridia bacterium]MBR1774084.1 hypothetical protein [Bacteroidales bacterium]